jgi:hypothetical protein
MSYDLSPTILTLKWLRKENSHSEDGIVLPKHVKENKEVYNFSAFSWLIAT